MNWKPSHHDGQEMQLDNARVYVAQYGSDDTYSAGMWNWQATNHGSVASGSLSGIVATEAEAKRRAVVAAGILEAMKESTATKLAGG